MPQLPRTPFQVDLELTSRCNARCAYCYYLNNEGVRYEDVPTATWLAFFDELAEAKVLEVKASGKLSKEDYALFVPAVDRMIEQIGKVKFLFVMHDFHGWEMGAVWEDTKFGMKHFRDIEKIAMVGDKTWEKWMATICRPFTMSAIKYFDVSEEEAAREWLAAE